MIVAQEQRTHEADSDFFFLVSVGVSLLSGSVSVETIARSPCSLIRVHTAIEPLL